MGTTTRKATKAATGTAAKPRTDDRVRTFKADIGSTGFAGRIADVSDTAGRLYLRRLAEALCEVQDVESRLSGAMDDFYSDGYGDGGLMYDSSVGEQVAALTEAISELIEETLCELSEAEDGTQDDNNY